MTKLKWTGLALLPSLLCGQVQAEEKELNLGLSVNLLFPLLTPQKETHPLVVSWGVSGFVAHGFSDNFSLGLSLDFGTFSALIDDYEYRDEFKQPRLAPLDTQAMFFLPALFGSYKILDGYLIDISTELGLGYLWIVYQDAKILAGDEPYRTVKDFAGNSPAGSLTVNCGFWPLDLLRLGLAVKYTYVPQSLLRHTLSLPFTVTFSF